MTIHVARSAGFCFGVKRAVRLALETAHKHAAPVYMLGEIVHNEHVVQELAAAGVRVVADLAEIAAGTLIIRAHGATPDVFAAARAKGLTIVDASCPFVLEIHALVRQLAEEGYTLVVIGDHGHDEVLGIAGQVTGATILASPAEAAALPRAARIGVVVQSTQNIENVQQIVALLAAQCRELKFFNTICAPTTQHQRDIRALPQTCEVMIIIGSRNSANTCRLTAIARALNPRTYHVESAAEVQPAWFAGVASVGISAGASTPEFIIQAVLQRIRALQN